MKSDTFTTGFSARTSPDPNLTTLTLRSMPVRLKAETIISFKYAFKYALKSYLALSSLACKSMSKKKSFSVNTFIFHRIVLSQHRAPKIVWDLT